METMKKQRNVESVNDFSFTVTKFASGRAEVVMSTSDVDREDLDLATKYMMWIVANESEKYLGESFDETMQRLTKGAEGFRGARLKVLPPKDRTNTPRTS